MDNKIMQCKALNIFPTVLHYNLVINIKDAYHMEGKMLEMTTTTVEMLNTWSTDLGRELLHV